MIEKIFEKLESIDDKALLTPNEINDLGVVLNANFEKSPFVIYRLIKNRKIKVIDVSTGSRPVYKVRGKDLKEFLRKRYTPLV